MIKLLQGNEACAYAALAAGVRFFAGYPITPSTEIAEIMSMELPKRGGKFIQMEDELASMAAIIGGSLGGLKSMTATSGPGLSLMQENIGYASITETPTLIVNVQRGGPSTGLPTMPSQSDIMAAKWGSHGDHPIIVTYPHTVPEIYNETIRSVYLSEKYRVPVILLLDEVIGHMREKIEIPDENTIEKFDRKVPTVPNDWFFPFEGNLEGVPPFASFGEGYRYHVTGLVHDVDGFPTSKHSQIERFMNRLIGKIDNNVNDILKWEEYNMEDAEYAILAAGCIARTARDTIKVLREKGIKIGLIRPVTIWPFMEQPLINATKKIKKLFVPELNLGMLSLEANRVLKGKLEVCPYNKINGEIIYPSELEKFIEEEI
ncbi:MAG: 2-oxoacid:acceptor oxidoreductase subunit alpha [Candidatus Muirbacterium halophilum]|nr:2-oxoacid:acceptor oxidoreductase subunit alpha [Candidatus Muirbacterium halophilum]MCK9476041.1 2-oxoacid:acceptor oxidoreductase subunit alpha [Candidatus Muirbacterium halophilum]